MRLTIVATVLSLTVAPSFLSAADLKSFELKTTRDLLDVCTMPSDNPSRKEAVHYCMGFLEGAVGYHNALTTHKDMKRLTCYPSGTTREDGALAFIAWAQARRDDQKVMSEAPVIGLMRSLSAQWPCKEG